MSPCADVEASERGPLIDDFEDGNNSIRGEPGRVGFWFVARDETDGTITPKDGFIPEEGAGRASAYAAHIKAHGFTNWGISFGTDIQVDKGAVKCAFNASAFKGISFYAKGAGRFFVMAQVPEIVPKAYGGTCDEVNEVCFNSHRTPINLTAEWKRYDVLWNDLLQEPNWGKKAEFNPSTIKSVQFAVIPNDLPADFWIDDVSFLLDNSGGSGGAGGSAGASGGAGGDAAAGAAGAGAGGMNAGGAEGGAAGGGAAGMSGNGQ